MLGPSDTPIVVVVDEDTTRRSNRLQQLEWRGFTVSGGGWIELATAHAAVVSTSSEDWFSSVTQALRASPELVIVLCGAASSEQLRPLINQGIAGWLEADAPVNEIADVLDRALDLRRDACLGQAAVEAWSRSPQAAIIADSAGRVLCASAGASSASPGRRVAELDLAGWQASELPSGASLWVGEQADSRGPQALDDVKLAAVSAFAGEAQHELNNFATYVLANLGALVDDSWASPEERAEMIQESIEGAEGMVDVVRRLRIAVQETANSGGVQSDIGEALNGMVERSGGVVEVIGACSAAVPISQARLQYCLDCLLKAAETASDSEKVTVRVSSDGDEVTARFVGTGPGLDRLAGRALFTSFLKESGRNKPSAESLSVVGAIVARAGGSASVRELEDGTGWFVLSVPMLSS